MKEIVDRILQEEEAARKRIESAQSQAEIIVRKAQEESKSLIENTVRAAEKSADEKKEEYERKFLADKEKILKETKDKTSLSRTGREKDIVKIAHTVFSRLITIKD